MGRRKYKKAGKKLEVGMLVEARPDLASCKRGWVVCRIAHIGASTLFLLPLDSAGKDISWAGFTVYDFGCLKQVRNRPAERNGDYLPGDAVHFLQKVTDGSLRHINVWKCGIVKSCCNGRVRVEAKEVTKHSFIVYHDDPYPLLNFNELRMADHVSMVVHCRRAVFCFLWFWRRVRGLQKDVGRLIAEMIWATRDYRCWQK